MLNDCADRPLPAAMPPASGFEEACHRGLAVARPGARAEFCALTSELGTNWNDDVPAILPLVANLQTLEVPDESKPLAH